ncbi:hypothetical protein [Pseudanabaena sp. PCC 6802]|uniref:hypothetical protein n=1 Tax=Pseudanabaena sp. PCC 6802 TaxID=118173 RepID=UPI0003455FB8|nr:hypothetical protein [Pseudanabaena sp. PCC 6802]
MKPKSFLESSSVRGSLVAICALVVGVVVPPVANIAARHLPESAQDIRDVERLLIGLTHLVTGGGALAAIAGRVNVGDLYTPKGLPGPDKEDLVQASRAGFLSKLIGGRP